ncbi:MAG TPA: hypothetical protein VLA52_17760 [Thermohalobaculum sp.]|nr:hypothetical protein [Thermohalobaculum sp.]
MQFRVGTPAAGWALAARPAMLALTAALLAGAPAAARAGCPADLARERAAEAPDCTLVTEGMLRSGQGNGDVAWQLYRWVPTVGEAPSALYDTPPYNQTAVTLSLAARPGDPPFWAEHYDMGIAWFETPYLAHNQKYGEFLVVPGRFAGTGSFLDDRVFLPNHGRGWTRIGAAGLDPETGAGWIDGLRPHLPPGHGIWKGISVDYATLTGSSAVWRDGDANCCPSGGEIRFRLQVAGPNLRLEVADAQYDPPAQQP